jgi:DNA-binding NarL/FixJ family response regulator
LRGLNRECCAADPAGTWSLRLTFNHAPEHSGCSQLADRVLRSRAVIGAGEAPTLQPSSLLSVRETEVLRLIAAGGSNQHIADQLVLSVRTVERHITNLYAKIGARCKADATAYAMRRGLA